MATAMREEGEGSNGVDPTTWKRQLSIIHKRTPVKTLQDYSFSTGKESKSSKRDEYFRDVKESSLAFVDPALSIFDMSTPKYKMTPLEDHPTSSSFWESSFIKATPETKIIDYMSNINARENLREDVNLETPTRPVPTRLEMDTPDSHDNSSFLTKNVIKALNFGASIDGDMSVIMKATDASIIDLSDTELTPQEITDNPKTPKTEEINSLAPPTKDTSPDSATLKDSEMKGELLTKFSRNALTSPHSSGGKKAPISPVREKEKSEFSRHLTAHMNYDRDMSFVDALTDKITEKVKPSPLQSPLREGNPSPEKNYPDNDRDNHVDEWKETQTPQGKTYFYNRRTRQSAWKLPDDAVYIPNGVGGYRIFTSRKDPDSIEPVAQPPPHLSTPASVQKPRSDDKITSVVSTPHPLQTPPRSRNIVATKSNLSSSPGVAFMKKPEREERSFLYCPLCGRGHDADKFPDHIYQCTLDQNHHPDNTRIKKLITLQQCLSQVLLNLRNSGKVLDENINPRAEETKYKSPHFQTRTLLSPQRQSPIPEKGNEPTTKGLESRKTECSPRQVLREEQLPMEPYRVLATDGPTSSSDQISLLSSTLPPSSLKHHSHVEDVKRPQRSLFACPSCNLSLKTRDDLVTHLRSCSKVVEDITSTRSDSFLVRSTSPAKRNTGRLYHKDDGSVNRGEPKSPSGCPFCGKAPLSKSSLSSHLLSCQKKKELKEKREATLIAPSSSSERRQNTPNKGLPQRLPSPASQTKAFGIGKSSTRGSSVPHVSRMVPFR